MNRSEPRRQPEPIFVGIDVAKDKLDIAVSNTGEVVTLANTKAGVAALVKMLADVTPTLTVIEATGGHQRLALDALPAAPLPLAFAPPAPGRDLSHLACWRAHVAAPHSRGPGGPLCV